MPYVRVGLYTFQPGTMDAIIAKARAELVPLTQRQPGLRRYYAIRSGPDAAASVTTWETEAQALAASENQAGWVRREFAPALRTAENHVGEVVISHVPSGAVGGHALLSLWHVQPGAADGLIAAVRTEYVPFVAVQAGFVGYGLARTGPEALASVITFDTTERLEAAREAALPLVERLIAGRAERAARFVGPIIWSVTGDSV